MIVGLDNNRDYSSCNNYNNHNLHFSTSNQHHSTAQKQELSPEMRLEIKYFLDDLEELNYITLQQKTSLEKQLLEDMRQLSQPFPSQHFLNQYKHLLICYEQLNTYYQNTYNKNKPY